MIWRTDHDTNEKTPLPVTQKNLNTSYPIRTDIPVSSPHLTEFNKEEKLISFCRKTFVSTNVLDIISFQIDDWKQYKIFLFFPIWIEFSFRFSFSFWFWEYDTNCEKINESDFFCEIDSSSTDLELKKFFVKLEVEVEVEGYEEFGFVLGMGW